MSLQSRLVWSSRESVAAQLVALLEESPRESIDLRFRCISLLGVFGSDAQVPLLKGFVFDPTEPYRIRLNALRVATNLGMTLTGEEFVRLMETPAGEGGWTPNLFGLFDYARLASFDEPIQGALHRLSPEDRSKLLRSPGWVPQPPELEAWLFELWCHSDRHLLVAPDANVPEGEELNVTVAVSRRERPEAWRLLVEWSEGLGERQLEELLSRLHRWAGPEGVARLASASSAFHDFVARRLLLPLDALLAHWGEEELLRRLDRVVQAENVSSIVPHGLVRGPRFFDEVVELMVSWEVARQRVLYRRLCDFGIASEVRFDLYRRLRKDAPSAAACWMLVAWRYPDNRDLVLRILERVITRAPMPEDRPVLLLALRETDVAVQRAALSALLALGESGPGWVDRLQSLSHSESPEVRVLAFAGLARHGAREGLAALRRMAVDAPDWHVRSVAIEWLGALDAEDSRPLFVDVLTQVVAGTEGVDSGGTKNGWSDTAFGALSRRGRDEDLSLLLEMRLRGISTQAADNHFRHHLARQEGEPVGDWPPRNTGDSWCEGCLMYEQPARTRPSPSSGRDTPEGRTGLNGTQALVPTRPR
ncbi:HEAT repeat domain-containing protein [Myxococcus stipitatus]|uniref:HEAT repeat domain-containing protein n=1 Tax=Myxococcus stipitatus TaxID=83455 RepID=UPI001F1B6396|nr:HEAT repeat domain-containing protein [Myxococcus stipitatus]MCE9666551.1 HEAT repeat domain-containing protein [Myxococcus stipitatus]